MTHLHGGVVNVKVSLCDDATYDCLCNEKYLCLFRTVCKSGESDVTLKVLLPC